MKRPLNIIMWTSSCSMFILVVVVLSFCCIQCQCMITTAERLDDATKSQVLQVTMEKDDTDILVGLEGNRNDPPPDFPLPSSWTPRIESMNMFYTWNDSTVEMNKMPMIGNGFLGGIIGGDGFYVSGVFSGLSDKTPSQRARFPATLNVGPPGKNGHCALDVARATYFRRSYIEPSSDVCNLLSNKTCTNSDGIVWIEQRWYAHQVLEHIMVMEIEVLKNQSEESSQDESKPFAVLMLENNSGGPSNTLRYNISTSSNVTYFNGTNSRPETNFTSYTAFAMATTTIPRKVVISSPGTILYFVTAIRTSLETIASSPRALLDAAAEDYENAIRMHSSLWVTHADAWEGEGIMKSYSGGKWEGGIAIDGRGDAAAAVNASLYAILSSARSDRPYSLSPGGLTNGYHGHTFWDAETWMYPPLLFLHPDLAESILFYRRVRLPQAYEKAQSFSHYNYSGAMFPWESAFTGVETCPLTSPTGLREIHISGDISFAFYQYWCAINGSKTDWIIDQGLPVITGIADFWVSKATIDTAIRKLCTLTKNNYNGGTFSNFFPSLDWDDRRFLSNKFCNYSSTIVRDKYLGKQWNLLQELALYESPSCGTQECARLQELHLKWYDAVYELANQLRHSDEALHIDNVIPPDEYHDHVNDSVYTNSVAKLSLFRAASLAKDFGIYPDEMEIWENVGNRIVILYNDTEKIHPEFRHYDGSKIKQADVILIYFPLQIQFGNTSSTSLAADLEYYAKRTDINGPAMTWSMYAVADIDLGNFTDAAAKFNRSFTNVQQPYQVWTETPTGGTPNFITGAGGFLQGVLFGYGGLRLFHDSVTVSPTLIPGSSATHFRKLFYANIPFEYWYNVTDFGMKLQSSSSLPDYGLCATLANATTLKLGYDWSVFPLQKVTLRSCNTRE